MQNDENEHISHNLPPVGYHNNKEVKHMRMRTIPKAVKLIKEEDPDTAITEALLRRMVKRKQLPVTIDGNNWLIDVDALPQYIFAEPEPEQPPIGVIRPVKE